MPHKELEDGQREEGIGVKVRQHHAVHGQHSMEEERHWWDHPCHQKAEEQPCVPRLMTDDFTGMGEDGRASLVRLIRHVSASCSIPCLLPCALTRRKGSQEWEPSTIHFLDLDFLGAMAQREVGAGKRRRSAAEEEGEGEMHRQQTD
jgi:hypothetical protein